MLIEASFFLLDLSFCKIRNKEQKNTVLEAVQICSENDTSLAGLFKVIALIFITLSSLFVMESPPLGVIKKSCEWGTSRHGLVVNMVVLG